jgi:hypothetical protein
MLLKARYIRYIVDYQTHNQQQTSNNLLHPSSSTTSNLSNGGVHEANSAGWATTFV